MLVGLNVSYYCRFLKDLLVFKKQINSFSFMIYDCLTVKEGKIFLWNLVWACSFIKCCLGWLQNCRENFLLSSSCQFTSAFHLSCRFFISGTVLGVDKTVSINLYCIFQASIRNWTYTAYFTGLRNWYDGIDQRSAKLLPLGFQSKDSISTCPRTNPTLFLGIQHCSLDDS